MSRDSGQRLGGGRGLVETGAPRGEDMTRMETDEEEDLVLKEVSPGHGQQQMRQPTCNCLRLALLPFPAPSPHLCPLPCASLPSPSFPPSPAVDVY